MSLVGFEQYMYKYLRNKAAVSARHSSIDDDTSPKTESGVWPGLYQEVLLPEVSSNYELNTQFRSHRLSCQGVDDLIKVKVFLAICVLLEELSRTVSEQLVISNLEFECSVIPSIIHFLVVRVDKSELFIRWLGCEDILSGSVSRSIIRMKASEWRTARDTFLKPRDSRMS